MVGSSLHHMNCSVCTCKVTLEVGDSAGIVRVVFLRFFQLGMEINQ
jgi:glycine cleavage system regulatory protein